MSIIKTKEGFKALVGTTENQKGYRRPLMFGICRVDVSQKNPEKVLQATYPVVNVNENFGSAAIFINALQSNGVKFDFTKSEQIFTLSRSFLETCLDSFFPFKDEAEEGIEHKNVKLISDMDFFIDMDDDYDFDDFIYKVVFIFEDTEPESVESVYLKLYALSLGKSELRSLNLNGAFGKLNNVAWDHLGNPIDLDWLRENEVYLKLCNRYPSIVSVDKFPRFLQHVIPQDNTRILDTSKVRFGAQLAAGTTVMPGASYINFNAGTLGPVMVEGRISSSAIVGAGSDVGGGASILGVLSGTDGNPISIGENTLLGANSTCGIPLGDGCIIDGGLAIFAGTKVTLQNINKIFEVNSNSEMLKKFIEENNLSENANIDMKGVKAYKLLGLNGIHFRRDSETGKILVMRSVREVKLNADLH